MPREKQMSHVLLDSLKVFWRMTKTQPWPFPLLDETSVWSSLCSFVGQVITLILRFQVAVIPCCAVISVSFGFYFSLEPTPKPRPLTQLPPVEPDPSPVPPDHEPSSVPPDHEDHEASVLFLERL